MSFYAVCGIFVQNIDDVEDDRTVKINFHKNQLSSVLQIQTILTLNKNLSI